MVLYRALYADRATADRAAADRATFVPPNGSVVTYQDWGSLAHVHPPPIAACPPAPASGRILFIVKTGATEAAARLPTHLATDLACVDQTRDVLFFSDLAESFASLPVHDALAGLVDDDADDDDDNDDFALYRAQQACARQPTPVLQRACRRARRPLVDDAQERAEAWALDKYKFVRIAVASWRLRHAADHDWFVFLDADTYLSVPTLATWLARLDPRARHFLGQRMRLGPYVRERLVTFAYGGSGYVLSRALLAELADGPRGDAWVRAWDARAADKSQCCGDILLADAVRDASAVRVRDAWPLLSGRPPRAVAFGPDAWCTPVGSLHHVAPDEFAALHAFERAWGAAQAAAALSRPPSPPPLLFRDLFLAYFPPEDTRFLYQGDGVRHAWTTPCDETWPWWAGRAPASVDACRDRCLRSAACYMWQFAADGHCTWSTAFSVGSPAPAPATVSGWDVAKIGRLMADFADCAEGVMRWPDVPGQRPAPAHTIETHPSWDSVADWVWW
ncbi:hypothetical protein P8C59_003415 [Phyllachora maydis]|nr:hypothetical protein P8C59_003415 [Phyllachora maydis]